eukprot:5098433-Pyramimonas_sp.AAC.2
MGGPAWSGRGREQTFVGYTRGRHVGLQLLSDLALAAELPAADCKINEGAQGEGKGGLGEGAEQRKGVPEEKVG